MKRVVRAGSPEILKIVGDSSPCSAETSFRELDDVFLQTQTRIWLGEVLHIRFDEETAIADLLADGELLFQLSKVTWKMLLKKHVELKHSKVHIHERTSSGKSDGRYMPYPKVDSFLKICQILGLTGVDLFSPSDVVEKRDVRRVCMCIRSFSKKARSKNLNVPDFDMVTYTIAMPTNLVGGIRRNLEQSQYSSSSSNGCSRSSMDSKELDRQRSAGTQSTLHYDSNSDSDEAESALIEFEFQSPLSNASCDATKFSNVIGRHSPEGNLVVDGGASELGTQFRMDSQKQIEIMDSRSIQDCNQNLEDALHCESSSSCTECQIDQGAEACFLKKGEVISPPRNPRDIIEINNADTSYYQNFASTDGHFPCDLNGPHAVDAQEDSIQSDPILRRKDLENNLAKHSSPDSNITLDHPKEEFVKALIGPSTRVQRVSCRPVDATVKLRYERNSNKNNILEFQDMVHKKTPQTENEVNAEGKREISSSCTFQMDPGNSVDDFFFHSIGDGYDQEMPAKGSSLSVGFVDLEQKDIQNGLKIKDANEAEVASLISWEDNHANNDYTAKTFSFPQVNNHKQVDLCEHIIEISANDHVRALEEEAVLVKEDSDLFTDGKHSPSVCTSHTVANVRVDSYTFDNGRSHVENMESTSLTTPDSHPFDTDYHTMLCSDSGSAKNDQISSSQLDSLSLPSNSEWKNNCFCRNPISNCNGNESKICSGKDDYPLEEGDVNVAFTSDLEMDADEKLNNLVMSIVHEDMIGNGLPTGERKICKSTTLDASENQLMEVTCNSGTEGGMKVSEEKDTSNHPDDMYKNPLVDVKENYMECRLQDSSHADDSSIPQMKLLHDSSRDSLEQIPFSILNGISEKEVSASMGLCVIDQMRNHESEIGEMDSSDESTNTHNVILEKSIQEGASEAIFARDPIHCLNCGVISTCIKDSVQTHEIFPCSAPDSIMERGIHAEEGNDVNNHGDAWTIDNVCFMKENEEADSNEEIKGLEECQKELVPKLSSSEKAKERAKGNKVLKSMAGAMTLIGALFLFHHVRHKREREKNFEPIAPQQNGKPIQELPEKKRVESVKPAVLYRGEKLKF